MFDSLGSSERFIIGFFGFAYLIIILIMSYLYYTAPRESDKVLSRPGIFIRIFLLVKGRKNLSRDEKLLNYRRGLLVYLFLHGAAVLFATLWSLHTTAGQP